MTDFQQQYINKMSSAAEAITQRDYQREKRLLNNLLEDLDKIKDKGHQIIIALDQIQRTPTLLLHSKTLDLKYYDEEAKALLIAYFDIIIHLQFAFEMYQIDIKYSTLDDIAISNFREFVEKIPYSAITINGIYYDIPTSYNIKLATGKGSKSVNARRLEAWEKTILMSEKAQDIYSLVGAITYLLDSNRESGEMIIASDTATSTNATSTDATSTDTTSNIDKSLPIIANLKLILRKFSHNNREELLSLIPLKRRIPKECTQILERL
jgi:hypothetical protein